MEPHLCSDKDSAVNDTGQNSTAVAATTTATLTQLSAGEGFVNNQDGQTDTDVPSDKTLQSSSVEAGRATSPVLSEDECVSLEYNSCVEKEVCEIVASDGRASVESLDHSAGSRGNQKATAILVDSKPKIIVEMEGEGTKEVEISNDEDLDPLITIDDSESQSSDLINFDTVSYDVIHQTSAEDEDDERSLATMSSLSCDLKMDSPAKHSHGSNSSSLINLLDSSVKETVGVTGSPSAQIIENGSGSAVSSCPSSPSLQSSKTTSSAVDGSISEAVIDNKAEDLQESLPTGTSLGNHTSSEVLEETNNIQSDSEVDSSNFVCGSPVDVNINETSLQTSLSENNVMLTNLDTKSEDTEPLHLSLNESDSFSTSNVDSEPEKSLKNSSNLTDNVQESDVICSDKLDRSESLGVYVELEEGAEDPQVLDSTKTLQRSSSLNNVEDSENGKNTVENVLILSVMPSSAQENVSAHDEFISTTPVQTMSAGMDASETVLIPTALTEDELAVTASAPEVSLPSSVSGEGAVLADTLVGSSATSLVSSTTEELVSADSQIIHNGVMENSVVTSSVDEENLRTDADNIPNPIATSLHNIVISLEENIPSSTTSLMCGEDMTSDRSNEVANILEEQGVSEVVERAGTPSPDSSMSNCITTEESSQLKSCDSPNKSAELDSLEAVSVISTEIFPVEQVETSVTAALLFSGNSGSPLQSPTEKSYDSSTSPERVSEDSEDTPFQTILKSGNSSPEKVPKSYSVEEKLKFVGPKLSGTESTNIVEHEIFENVVINNTESCHVSDPDCGCHISLPNETITQRDVKSSDLDSERKPVETEIVKSLEMCKTDSLESLAGKSERPTTLPDVNSTKPEKSCIKFSELLGLVNPHGISDSVTSKQYSAAALDEAQQMASGLVDSILQMAVLKAEKELVDSKNLTIKRVEAVEAAHALVDEVLIAASAQASYSRDNKAEVSATCDINDSGEDFSLACPEIGDLKLQETDKNATSSDHVVHPSAESTLNEAPVDSDNHKGTLVIIPISKSSSLDDCSSFQSDSALPKETSQIFLQSEFSAGTEQHQLITESAVKEVSSSLSNASSEVDLNVTDKCSSDTLNQSGENSLSGSSVDACPQNGSARTSSTDNGATNSARSSLVTCSDLGLRSEASLFVDGVLEEAVKKYEESSSSESSPVKLKRLNIDPDFLQEDEELATPCGEMLTEHFMDFESGRNVSVFCTLPESGSEDHLYACDRTAHTIGNREVDSGTGKSVSVFRMEEDVYYEIQRASTCTSVFESVEEEDEDMIDTTVPVEDRPRTMKTSLSFPSFDRDKLEVSDSDAFEDAVGAFLTKERLARDDIRHTSESNPCRALVLKHPEIDLSNQEEKKRMAEKWANGGESEVPDTPEMREKQRAIREALDSDEDVAVKLCKFALTEGGLINDSLRREAWPRMLGLDPTLEIDAPSLEDLKSHPEYGQVVLDVNRSLKRFPPDIPKDQRETLQDKLTRLIMYVISKHPHLRYYQGYHDVAVTFLLVVGESVAFQIMERLSTEHLSDCMQPTMERTSYLLHFIYPLLHRIHPTLAEYLERSEVGTMFCLPWFLTWFGHSLDRYQDVVRLYDHFLASPPLAPLYVAAVLVAHRADEVLSVDCDMAAVHALLSHIPDSLPLEILLRDATELYLKFPPESIEREVEERFRNEQEMRNHEIVERNRLIRRRRGLSHGGGGGPWQLAEVNRFGGTMMAFNRWIPPWVVQQQRLSMRLLFASATFFVGFYVYSRGGDMLPY